MLSRTVLGLAFAFMWSAAASATCVSIPDTNDLRTWNDIRSHVASASLNSAIDEVQALDSVGHGQINLDFYAITLDAQGQSASDLLSEIRANIHSVVYQGTNYAIEPYDAANQAIWTSDAPVGALVTFVLSSIPGVMDIEKGDVVVSCYDATTFIFSPVTTNKSGYHPVAGNRGFGIVRNKDGSLTFFTKAADRIVNRGLFSLLPEALRNQIFLQGHDVWVRMLANIETIYASRNPRDKIIVSSRHNYP
ncbi:hypothetical protein [Nisaea nitritireducens]|uniref:hypothetical protein n=1 Tax=Nisaea nitritireducens TaxID=568392 RepID=UPI0018665374|nr:hypothetical protein [Nisaea nitritireducens]